MPILNFHNSRQGKASVEVGGKKCNIYMHKLIGKGCYGCAIKVWDKTDGCEYACKVLVDLSCTLEERLTTLTDIHSLAALRYHRNVVAYYSSWFVGKQTIYMQLELCDHNLTDSMRRNLFKTEDDYLHAMYQICSGLHHMHSNGLAHMDVKPDNILIKDGVYKLGDFGRTILFKGKADMGLSNGDGRYACPRIMLSGRLSFPQKADMFSLGASFVELAYYAAGLYRPPAIITKEINEEDLLNSPLNDPDEDTVQPQILKLCEVIQVKRHPCDEMRETLIFDCSSANVQIPYFSGPFANLIKSLIAYEPSDRPFAAEVLKNPIFDHIRSSYDEY